MEMSSAPVLPGREAAPVERVEMARVDADLLDTMLNNAGEVSIFRARLDQQVNSIDFNLAELARTVTRLKEQLRGLEIETEAQGAASAARHRAAARRFRSSRVGPVLCLAAVLARACRNIGRCSQHSRPARDLDARGAKSLDAAGAGHHRIAKQPDAHAHGSLPAPCAASDAAGSPSRQRYGQACGTRRAGAAAELDRQMLERMVAPLEHMLRNSVVHGIETPDRRGLLGKPDVGRISISLERDGAEIVIVGGGRRRRHQRQADPREGHCARTDRCPRETHRRRGRATHTGAGLQHGRPCHAGSGPWSRHGRGRHRS